MQYHKLIILIVCLIQSTGILSQENSKSETDKTSWSLYILSSAQLESTRAPTPDTWSHLGFGGGMYHKFDSGLGINARLSFRSWDRFGFDKSTIPFSIGPSYEFNLGSKLSLSIYGGVGPAFIWGNDYAGIFGSFDFGTEMYFPAWANNRLFIRTAFAQGMTFNSGFNYLDFAVGLRL